MTKLRRLLLKVAGISGCKNTLGMRGEVFDTGTLLLWIKVESMLLRGYLLSWVELFGQQGEFHLLRCLQRSHARTTRV